MKGEGVKDKGQKMGRLCPKRCCIAGMLGFEREMRRDK
jgi:hypothetical protein